MEENNKFDNGFETKTNEENLSAFSAFAPVRDTTGNGDPESFVQSPPSAKMQKKPPIIKFANFLFVISIISLLYSFFASLSFFIVVIFYLVVTLAVILTLLTLLAYKPFRDFVKTNGENLADFTKWAMSSVSYTLPFTLIVAVLSLLIYALKKDYPNKAHKIIASSIIVALAGIFWILRLTRVFVPEVIITYAFLN